MMKLGANSWNTSDIWVRAAILFLLGIFTRLAFRSDILHEWDSVNFALALDRFDVRLDQPHAPGTFVFYILLGRLFRLFLHDANASLVAVSILATGLAASTMFVLGTTWFNRRTGWVMALLMLTSPLVWFHGEVALSYMLEFWWVLLIVLACYGVRVGNQQALFISALLMGLAGGIRPNTGVFLFPLWVVSAVLGWRASKYSLWRLIAALILMLATNALWVVPMVMMTGGWDAYYQALQPWLTNHPKDAKGLHALYLNVKQVTESALYGLGFAWLPLFWVLRKNWNSLSNIRYDLRLQTLVLWIVPGLLYLNFIHIQRAGHTFTIMPALIAIGGIAIAIAGSYLEQYRKKAPIILIGMVLVGNSLFFLFGPGQLNNIPTWTTIWQRDTYVGERLEAIRQQFPPTETMVLTRGQNARLREYYLQDYFGTSKQNQLTEEMIAVPQQARSLVLFDPQVLPKLSADSGFKTLPLPTTGRLRYITWNNNQQVKVSKSALVIENK